MQIVPSVAAALDGADAAITSLPKPEHVRGVYGGADGILAHAAPSTLLLDTSTVDVETSRWCHAEAQRHGLSFVDAPISGGTAGAEAHTLTFMLGGRAADVERAREVVAPMAGNVIACGEAGAGIAAKLVNNMMLFISVMAVSEGSQLAEQLGLDPQVFWDVARVSSADSWALRTWYPVPGIVETSAANKNFDATFSVDLARKDCGLAFKPETTPVCTCRRRVLRSASSTTSSPKGWAARTARWSRASPRRTAPSAATTRRVTASPAA